jgi:hypothetical protein
MMGKKKEPRNLNYLGFIGRAHAWEVFSTCPLDGVPVPFSLSSSSEILISNTVSPLYSTGLLWSFSLCIFSWHI